MLLVQIAGSGAGDAWRQRCARTVQGRTRQAEARAECAAHTGQNGGAENATTRSEAEVKRFSRAATIRGDRWVSASYLRGARLADALN